MAIPALLVASLARHLNVASVVFLSGSTDDLDLDLSVSVFHEASAEFYYTTALVPPKGEGPLLERVTDSLIIDEAGAYQEIQEDEDYFEEGNHWITSRPVKEPPAGLKLYSNFYTLSDEDGAGLLVIQEWYRLKKSLYTTLLGRWSQAEGLDVPTPLVWERRKNLHKITLKTVTMPWVFFSSGGGDGTFQGLVPDIVRVMETASNFTTKWEVPPDKMWGSPSEDGTWNGMVGMLHRQEADLAATGLAVTLERSDVVSYTYAFMKSRATLTVLNPSYLGKEGGINLASFFSVFTRPAWVAVVILSFGMSGTYLANFMFATQRAATPATILTGMSAASDFTFRALFRLDFSLTTGVRSKKILFLSTGAFSIIVAAYYEGIMTSYLTARPIPPQLHSYADTIDYGYQVVVASGTSHATDLEHAPVDSGRHEVYEKMMKDNPAAFYPSLSAMRDAMLENSLLAASNSEFSFFGDERFLPLTRLNDMKMDHIAFALQKDSELLGLFNHYLINMYQSGLIGHLKDKWLGGGRPEDYCTCRIDADQAASPLGFKSLLLPIIILCGGIAAAHLLMLLERMCRWVVGKKYCRMQRNS